MTTTKSATPTDNTSDLTRFEALRQLALTDLPQAQKKAWAWLEELADEPSAAVANRVLLELLASGTPAEVDGRSDGRLLRWVDDNDLNPFGRALLAVAKGYVAVFGSPWLGKKYDQANSRGTNTLTLAAKVLTTFIAPRFPIRKVGDHYEGFEMYTRVEDSVLVPGYDVLVLDFESIGTNPWPVNLIHDEVVQLVPGVYLGTKTMHTNGGYQQVAWWATCDEGVRS